MYENNGPEYLRRHVIGSDLCTNCGACVNICPYFASYRDRTVVLDDCNRIEGDCFDVCPRTPTDFPSLKSLLFNEKDLTTEVGALKAFYITRAKDEHIRKSTQHGGTVTSLVDLALASGVVDAAVLSGISEPLLPCGIVLREAGQASRFGRSNFVVSPTIAKFNELAREEAVKSIAVVATPCQALALAKMRINPSARTKARSDKLSLVIGIFCGWALSWTPFKELISKKVDLNSIIGMDIPPSRYNSFEVKTVMGEVHISLDELRSCIRPSCSYCSDMTAEFSDVSIGSARLQEGWEEAQGWNQVIVRTNAGQKLLSLAKKEGILEFREVPDGNLEKLKKASDAKKRRGMENLAAREKRNRIVR
ncbi:MAG: Coenzyme F420 hydrogenase/dehydrogenase, beta subunit C-terminal domain [Syntrophaceae bacterium]|nr:Coenzyme F420 hydrogenase/dehydrogenase, beta subunit C-terminal domain [Syntrophaceae bacterium]